jgi:Ca2+-binding RTX toxin-like protein
MAIITGTSGNDSIVGTAQDDSIVGIGGNDTLLGRDGNDSMSGGEGNDTLRGESGNDTLEGGSGSGSDTGADSVSGGDGDDVLRQSKGADTLDGGAGEDRLDFLATGVSYGGVVGISVNLATHVSDLDSSSPGANAMLISIETVFGTQGNDSFTGGDSAHAPNALGRATIETFRPSGGNDTITGAAGNGWLTRVDYSSSSSAVTVNLLAGTATDGFGGTDTLVRVDFVEGGSGNDLLYGGGTERSASGELYEVFRGNAGNDTINGAGPDTVQSAAGNDRVHYGNSPAAVIVNLGTTSRVVGNDTVPAGAARDGFGFTDTLARVNQIEGSPFSDTLIGGGDGHRLIGGAGNDTLIGAAGGVEASYENSPNAVILNLDSSTVSDGEGGTDTLQNIADLRGSDFGDFLIGNGADNRLAGGPGADTLDGGAGTDTARFSGNRAAYQVASTEAGVTVTGPDGTDALRNIERLQFSDLLVVLDDLSISSQPTLGAASAVAGESVTVDYRVDNLASATSGASTSGIYLSTDSTVTTADTLLATDAVAAIAAGLFSSESVSTTLPGNLAAGTYYIGVLADRSNALAESNETNNRSPVVAITVTPGTSLSIAATDADKAEGDSGTTPFTFTVTRVGTLTDSTTANWAVSAGTTGPAASANDFGGTFPGGTVTFASGEAEKVITVNVAGDTSYESGGLSDAFTVTLSGPSSGTIGTASASGYIRNDDPLVGTSLNDVLNGGDGDDTVNGVGGDDSLNGGPGDDALDGGDGDDNLIGGPGDDTLNGGDGLDTANYGDALADNVIDAGPSGITVTGSAGSDTLLDTERIRFSDANLAFDLDAGEAAGDTVRLIGAAFDRPAIVEHPDWVGMGLELFEVDGMSMQEVCELVIEIIGNPTDELFVTRIYTNVVGAAPSPEDHAYFVGLLTSGANTQAELLALAANSEPNAANIDLVGLQESGVEFI